MSAYEPTWLNEEIRLPRDRQTLSAWARAFVALNPIVSSTVEFYSKIPLRFLKIEPTCDAKVNQFLHEQKETVGLDNILYGALRELWTHGEAFLYLNLDERKGSWSEIQIQNPDYVIVKRDLSGNDHISLRPDERLRDAVLKDKTEELKTLSPDIIASIKDGKNIELSDFYVAHLATKLTPYETRGSSPLLSAMKLLASSDQLRAANASQDEIKEVDNQIKQAICYPYDKHNGIARDVIATRVLHVMTMLMGWLRCKYFAPIAKINDFYKMENGEKKLIVPVIHFDIAGFKECLSSGWSS